MSDYYLELEKPIYEIEKRIKLIQKDIDADSSIEIDNLRKEKEKMTKENIKELIRLVKANSDNNLILLSSFKFFATLNLSLI